MRFNHANAEGFYTDLAIPFNANSLYYKAIRGGAVANSGWVRVLDALNYNTYSPTLTGVSVVVGDLGDLNTNPPFTIP